MTISRKLLCVLYALVAAVALVGTWGNNLQLDAKGPLEANVLFWSGTLATPISRSITVDLFLLGLPVTVWMLLEARRLAMRGVWIYIILGGLVAISVTVPVFLLQRERRLARTDGPVAGTLSVGDLVGVVILCVVAVVYTVFALVRREL